MIEEPALITLRRRVPRPTPAQIAAFAGVPTGFVADALGGRGAMAAAIKPVVPEQASFCGVALPVHVGPADNLAAMMALSLVQQGDVMVAAADGFMETAVTGDLLLGMMRNLGAVGFVTDGCARDIVGIRDMGLPCFAAGITPNSPTRNGPGTINLPVICGGVAVGPGDILVGDLDGVVVVPYARIATTITRLEAVKAAEAALLPKVQAGLGIPPFVSDLVARIRIEALDD